MEIRPKIGRRKMTANPLIKHQEAFELTLCQRDYELMDAYRPEILRQIEGAIDSGAEPETIRKWALRRVVERELVQRIHNASLWYAASRK